MFNFFSKPKEAATLPFKTDIHCHVVPGIDDGSPNAATSADLIERMQSFGIERIIASPHVTKDTFENTRQTIDEALDLLQAELDARHNPIQVTHHAEYRLDDFSLAQIEQDPMLLPQYHILIENPFVDEPWNLDTIVFDLQIKGYKPILAHPERYSYYFNHRERFKALHNAGTKFQINLLSLAGAYGKEQRNIAEFLINENMVEFVGTDIHNMRHIEIIDSYLKSKQALKDFKALGGKLFNDRL